MYPCRSALSILFAFCLTAAAQQPTRPMAVRALAKAARALGILRGRAAVPDLLDALRSKDTDVIYESLNALQKIHDESAATRLGFLLRDPNQKVQITAIETVGLLQNKAAAPELI